MSFDALRLHALAGALFLSIAAACGSSTTSTGASPGGSTATGPAPAGTLACKGPENSSNECSCDLGSARTGSCAPQNLGGVAHCCATVNAGVTTQCRCVADPAMCIDSSASVSDGAYCTCATGETPFGDKDKIVAACAKPAGGHCCRSQSNPRCTCSMQACAATDLEVDSCAAATATLLCPAPSMPVTLCQ